MELNLNKKDKILILAGFFIGIISTNFHDNYAALWSLIPLLVLESTSRTTSFLVSYTFFLSMSRGIVPGAYIFFRDGSLIRALTLWFLSSLALAAPYFFINLQKSKFLKGILIVLAVLVSIPPPLGLIGWGNPLTSAGLFFPCLKWVGLLIMLLCYFIAALSRTIRLTLVGLILLFTPFLEIKAAPQEANIKGINTSFGMLASGSYDFDTQYERERQVFQELRRMLKAGELSADVIVLPETLAGRLNPSVKRRWNEFFMSLKADTVFVVGGELPKGDKYDNVMLAFKDEHEQTAIQRSPVPFSMYIPLGSNGANADIFSLGKDSMMILNGKKAAFLICYEQFLTWPLLSILSQKPDMIIAPSNFWWCKDTSLPTIRDRALKLWATLFGLPVVSAVNI